MFEKEYKRANDRIHPRKDLLKEMEANWAKESTQPPEEEGGKVVAFPAWAKYAGMAAGVLLCVGLGMASVTLFSRKGGRSAAEVPQMQMAEITAEEADADEKIVVEAKSVESPADMDSAMGAEAMLAAPAALPLQGMHPAADEAEVEGAILYGNAEPEEAEANLEAGAAVPEGQRKAVSETTAQRAFVQGKLIRRGDLLAVFMPTLEQVRVIRYSDRKLNKVFSLGLREKDTQVKQVFWMGSELFAVRERDGETELLRFEVSDWEAPRHLLNMTQSGTFLWAGEMDGRLCILSAYRATEEEPFPWVNGERIDYDRVLLDSERPGDTFAVLTVYDPAQSDGFASQIALLADVQGAAAAEDALLLWTGTDQTDLYAFSWTEEGLALTAEGKEPGVVLSAMAGDGFMLLMQTGDGVSLLALDGVLNETPGFLAKEAGPVRCAGIYEDGAFFLTDDALHALTMTGDRAVELTGDGFVRLAEDRVLVLSEAGQLQLVGVASDALELLSSLEIRDSLSLLLEDPSRLDYDPATGRLVFPAGQKVYLFQIDETGKFTQRNMPLAFQDHSETEQRELRCLLGEEQILVFNKAGVAICNQNLVRQNAWRY